MNEDRDTTDRYRELLDTYRRGLAVPGPELTRAVMAVLRDRPKGAHRETLWRWFLQPHDIRVRPLLAAAGLAVMIGLSALVTALGIRDGGEPAAETAPPGTMLVRFELLAPQAERVALAGSFNEWSDSTTLFVRNAESGIWSVTVTLQPGQYQYLFVVDGDDWIPDPDAHAQVDDGFGNTNSMIVVGPRGVVRS